MTSAIQSLNYILSINVGIIVHKGFQKLTNFVLPCLIY